MKDLAIVGCGPAGLSIAAAAAARGLDVVALDRRRLPADKACGEGILPAGARALEALGVLRHLDPDGWAPLSAIRWIQEDGTTAEARLPAPGGLGVRRLALSAALLARAREAGAEVRDGVAVTGHRREGDGVTLTLDAGDPLRARLLVAADGLASPVREREGLGRSAGGGRRFGLRRHFRLAPWSDAVEVHFAGGAEAYVTPVGPRRVGVAFLFEEATVHDFGSLLARFPAVAARLGDAPHDSALAGAGPLRRPVAARIADRLVLAGDAGGYEDAITGEGVSVALEEALSLARALPGVLARGASRESLAGWARAAGQVRRRQAAVARLVLWMAQNPRVRRATIGGLSLSPRLFDALLARAVSRGAIESRAASPVRG